MAEVVKWPGTDAMTQVQDINEFYHHKNESINLLEGFLRNYNIILTSNQIFLSFGLCQDEFCAMIWHQATLYTVPLLWS